MLPWKLGFWQSILTSSEKKWLMEFVVFLFYFHHLVIGFFIKCVYFILYFTMFSCFSLFFFLPLASQRLTSLAWGQKEACFGFFVRGGSETGVWGPCCEVSWRIRLKGSCMAGRSSEKFLLSFLKCFLIMRWYNYPNIPSRYTRIPNYTRIPTWYTRVLLLLRIWPFTRLLV